MSLERGHDPRGFVLVCFGGASGLHAGECAAELGIRRILLLARSGVFSAQGMAEADLVLERSQALFVAGVEGADSVIKDGLGVLVRALEAKLEEMGTHPSVVSCVKYRNRCIRFNFIFWIERDGKLHILTDTRCMTRH